jgi:hypothetical protein
VHSAKKGIIRPDTASKESVQLNAYFKGVVVTTKEVSGTYIIIIRDGDRFDTYSNLTSVKVKKGDKVKKGQVIGTADVDLATGIPKLKYQMYNGDVMVYDADGNDTAKRSYGNAYIVYDKNGGDSVKRGYGRAYMVYTSKKSSSNTSSSGSQVYTASPAPSYSASGTGSYSNSTYAVSPAPYTTAAYNATSSGNASPMPSGVVIYQAKPGADPVTVGSGRTYLTANVSYVTADNNADELVFTIDPKHTEESQFARMEKQFADNGFKLKIKGDLKNNNDSKLRIEISGSKDNNTSSASAVFSSDDLHNSNSVIKITGDKKTGLVSITTYTAGR